MAQQPTVRDAPLIKSSVPFPTANSNQPGAPPEHHRRRTRSNSSSSSSSGFVPHQSRPPAISMSRQTYKQLSPVVEECEDVSSRNSRVGSRSGYRPRPRPTSYVGQTGLIAEDLTIAMMSIIPPPPRRETRAPTRQSSISRTKSRFQNLRQSIRVRLPTMRSVRVWKRS